MVAGDDIQSIPVEELIPFVGQSRERFDEAELRELANDIKTNGLLQPGVAWFDAGRGKYVLICGERRWRALKLAGLAAMEVKILRGSLTQAQMLAMNIAENIQRASLNPIERAKAFQRLAQLEDLSGTEVAERLHVSGATVSRELALLGLSEELQGRIAAGVIPASVGYLLTRLPDDGARQELAEQVAAGKLSRARVEEIVGERSGRKPGRPKDARLVCRLEGLTIRVSGGEPPSWEGLIKAFDRLKREAQKLKDGGSQEIAALAAALRAPGS